MEKTKNLENLQQKEYQIEWVYWDRKINISTFWIKNNDNLVINIHWTFWSKNWWNNKYLNFAKSLQEENISNVVLYESSRKNIEIDTSIWDIYKQKQKKFIWKTFEDELEDARRVIKEVILNSKELFWVEKEKLNITLNWNSLWWILAFYLAKEFWEIKNIVSVGTGLRLSIENNVPILDTFPNINELKDKLQSFKWKYVNYYWTEDDVFTEQSFFDLINLVWSDEKDKSEIEMIWVNHNFWKIWGKKSDLPFKQIFLWYKSLLKEWIMISWWHNMISKLKNLEMETKNQVDWTLEQWKKYREELFWW